MPVPDATAKFTDDGVAISTVFVLTNTFTPTFCVAAPADVIATVPLQLEEADRVYVHASAAVPAAWHYIIDAYDARESLEATAQRVTLCGHVHVPAVYHTDPSGKLHAFTPAADVPIPLLQDRRWLAVLGAVGQPRDGVAAACYAVLDDAASTLTYIRVPYDIASAAAKIRAAGLPLILATRLAHGY